MSELATPRRRVLDDWRANHDADRRAAAVRSDDLVALWSAVVLVLMLLYLMIGQSPYKHEVELDPLTGAAVASPLNRMIWLALLGLSVPILWFRRAEVLTAVQRLWPLLLMFLWFAATTSWAIDQPTSGRRLFLYVVNLIICVALVTGLRDARRMHAAIATACAIVIIIDVVSWIVAPAKSMTFLGLAAIHNHKNTLGSVMLLSGLVISPYILFERRLAWRLFWGAMFLGCVALLIGSKSKTSMAILAVGILATPVILAVLRLRLGALQALLAASLLLVAGALFGWLTWSYGNGMDPLGPLRKLTFTQRTEVWAFALDEFAKRPLTGLGFASFWDVDPKIQPSLQTGEWFAQPNSYTNESHNGYIDLLVTTGIFGLLGALYLLGRWTLRSLTLMRRGLMARTAEGRADLPYSVYLGMFPLVFFVHNWMESSFFTANAMFGIVILLLGIDVDMRFRSEAEDPVRRRRALPVSGPRPLPQGWLP